MVAERVTPDRASHTERMRAMTTTQTHIIATTIFEQLGGRRFAFMTGAKNFMSSGPALLFSLPGSGGFCKDSINRVSIRLTGRDDYDVTFSRVRGSKVTAISTHEGIYADQLRDVFTAATGLQTSLGTMGR